MEGGGGGEEKGGRTRRGKRWKEKIEKRKDIKRDASQAAEVKNYHPERNKEKSFERQDEQAGGLVEVHFGLDASLHLTNTN